MKLTVAMFEQILRARRSHLTFQQYCTLDGILQDLIRLEQQGTEPPPFLPARCESETERQSDENV